MDVAGRAMLEALIAGIADPDGLVQLARERLRAKKLESNLHYVECRRQRHGRLAPNRDGTYYHVHEPKETCT